MPNTDPNHWFLPQDVLPRRPGYTSENQVEALIDGEAYMSHLAGRIARMRAGDYLHIAGWRVTPTQCLLPNVPDSPTLMDQMATLISRGVIVRAMLWYFPISVLGIAPNNHARDNITFVRGVVAAGGTAILDRRLRPRVFSAHHQKTAVLSSGGEDWAYVGGLDICAGRWDIPLHNEPPGRTPESSKAWHDVHCAVRGPAVAQIWRNFEERWNDRTSPHTHSLSPGGAPPEVIIRPPPRPESFSTHHVQVLRTLSCDIYPFLPAGEQTIRQAYEQAIDRAKHYIYIEDQYFWPCSIISKLSAATARGVKVVLVLSHKFGVPLLAYYHNKMRHDALDRLRSANPSNVYVYHLQKPRLGADIYVHSKVMIIDDCYATIGSANIGWRSSTTDSELHLSVVDDDVVPSVMDGVPVTVCRFAKDLRISLWTEHLGLINADLIQDPIAGIAEWPDCSNSTPDVPNHRHHTVGHHVPTPRWHWPQFIPKRYMNTETACSGI